ncbi:MAG: alpha-amylase family glycosyl hydrolase [Ilumatobacteraceae bacterium]
MRKPAKHFVSRGIAAATLIALAACSATGRSEELGTTSDAVDDAALEKADDATPVAGSPEEAALIESLAVPIVYSDFASRVIYFVMTDRYANGNPANDGGFLSGQRKITGFDPTDIGFFHGGDLRGLTGGCTDPKNGLQRLADLGFNGIWITPLVVQRTVQGDSAAYHGYWGVDFTTVDPRFGTEAELVEFVDCAHSLGMKVYLDVVVNHTGDVIMLVGGSGFVEEPSPAYEAYVLPDESSLKKPEWMNDTTNYHNRGDINWSGCSKACIEQGDFSGLDDLYTEKPEVVDGLAEVFGSWITRFKFDGFRVDTARHVDREFYQRWVPQILKTSRSAGIDDFEIFGETWITEPIEQSVYEREWGLPNQLDFPLHDAIARYAGGLVGAGPIMLRLEDDDYSRTDDGRAPTPGTFIGNHDIGRTAMVIKGQSGAEGRELLQRVNLGHSLLYLSRGAPIIYYGDEYGIIGTGGDKEARQDLFPTQVSSWQSQERVGSPPIGLASSFETGSHPVGEHLRELARLRREVPVLWRGATLPRARNSGTLAISRFDVMERLEYVTLFNNSLEAVTLLVPTSTPNATFDTVWGPVVGAASDTFGEMEVAIPPLSASVLRASVQFPVRKTNPIVTIGPDDFSDLWLVSAETSDSPQEVSFIIDSGDGWRRVSVDDSAPYRGFLTPSTLPKSGPIRVVAVSRFADGSVMRSDIQEFDNEG